MPGPDKTGPQGNGPIIIREFSRCRVAPVPAQEPVDAAQPAHNEDGSAISQGSAHNNPVNGRRRREIPCGRGQGFEFGGRRLLQA